MLISMNSAIAMPLATVTHHSLPFNRQLPPLLLVLLPQSQQFELVHHFVRPRGDYVFVVHLHLLGPVLSVAADGHDAHAGGVVGGEAAEVLRRVVLLDDEVVDAPHCLHETGHPSPVVGTALVDEAVVDEGPDALVLVHVRADVEVHQAPALVGRREVLEEAGHVEHGVTAVRVHLRAGHRVVRGHEHELVRVLVPRLQQSLPHRSKHGAVLLGGALLVDLEEGVVEQEGGAVGKAVGLHSRVDSVLGGQAPDDEAVLEQVHALGQHGLVVANVDDQWPEPAHPRHLVQETQVHVAVVGLEVVGVVAVEEQPVDAPLVGPAPAGPFKLPLLQQEVEGAVEGLVGGVDDRPPVRYHCQSQGQRVLSGQGFTMDFSTRQEGVGMPLAPSAEPVSWQVNSSMGKGEANRAWQRWTQVVNSTLPFLKWVCTLSSWQSARQRDWSWQRLSQLRGQEALVLNMKMRSTRRGSTPSEAGLKNMRGQLGPHSGAMLQSETRARPSRRRAVGRDGGISVGFILIMVGQQV